MLNKIRSIYIIQKIFKNVEPTLFLKLIKCNKNLQKKLEITKGNYLYYNLVIEIELIPTKKNNKAENVFVNINEKEKNFYQFYINKKRVKRNYFSNKEKISKIKIRINNEIKSLRGLFADCRCIQEIKFIKFNIKDIKITFKNFDTSKVKNMSNMFEQCISLKRIDLSKFDTSSLIYMSNMFYNCESLTQIDLSNFNTSKIYNIDRLCFGCNSLRYLDLSSFRYGKLNGSEKYLPDNEHLRVIYMNKHGCFEFLEH